MIIFRTLLYATFAFMLSGTSTYAADNSSIRLKDLEDRSHPMSEYIGNGKWTVLNIWGPGCPPCREEMPDLVYFHENHHDKDAQVVGVAIDFPSYGYADKDKVAAFTEEFLIDFPILLSDASITERLGLGVLQGLPTTYVYYPDGKVAGMQVGGITADILERFIDKNRAWSKNSQEKNN